LAALTAVSVPEREIKTEKGIKKLKERQNERERFILFHS